MTKAKRQAQTAVKGRSVSPVLSNRTDKEQELFRAYLEGSSIRSAAKSLGIPNSTAALIIKKMIAASPHQAPKRRPSSAPEPVKTEAPAFQAKSKVGTHNDYPNLFPYGFDAPSIKLSSADAMLPAYKSWRRTRRCTLGQNPQLLLDTPTPTSFRTR